MSLMDMSRKGYFVALVPKKHNKNVHSYNNNEQILSYLNKGAFSPKAIRKRKLIINGLCEGEIWTTGAYRVFPFIQITQAYIFC